MDLTAHTSLSPIRRGFAPRFVIYKKECTRLATASDKVYQLLAEGRWFSSGTPASSTTKTGRHDIAEILLKVALNTKNQIKSNQRLHYLVFQYFGHERLTVCDQGHGRLAVCDQGNEHLALCDQGYERLAVCDQGHFRSVSFPLNYIFGAQYNFLKLTLKSKAAYHWVHTDSLCCDSLFNLL